MVKIPCKHGLWKAFRGNSNDDISQEMLQKKSNLFRLLFKDTGFSIFYQ